jgi:uncharacterized protein YjbI with pentapeptide repeats
MMPEGQRPEGQRPEGQRPEQQRPDLTADCANCFALCCVAPAFSVSADFALDKRAGQPCPNLRADFGCSIHDRLRPRGFAGCTVYDCFGAGQKVAQVTFAGQDWRRAPDIAEEMFAVFAIMRQLHELLWYLSQALLLGSARPVHDDLRRALDETERLTRLEPEALLGLEASAYRQDVNALLLRASELARAPAPHREPGSAGPDFGAPDFRAPDFRAPDFRAPDFRGADLVGKDLRGIDLSGANLRGAQLVGANLSGVSLAVADFTGADLRGADLRGADLSASIFLTQSQLDAARGDSRTRIPPSLASPACWD